MKRLLRPVMLALAVAMPMTARAHPHVMVDTVTEIVFDEAGRVTALRHHWTFDEMYSTFAVQGLDRNKDGTFSREELQELANLNVEGLREFDFFSFMKHERRIVSFADPKDPYLTHDKGRLTLNFVLPVKEPFTLETKQLGVEVYDPSYFVAFMPAEGEPVMLSGAPKGCGLDYRPPKQLDAAEAMRLGESFFTSAAGASFGAKLAGRIVVACK